MKLGLGAGPLGDHALDDGEMISLVHQAIDLGVTVFDTAVSYGASEDRLGRALEGRRHAVTLVTKGGYGVPEVEDWSSEAVTRSAEAALRRLRTDYLDVFLLHSCDASTVPRVIDALVSLRSRGLTRAIGYSGDNDGLFAAHSTGVLDVIECSVNLFDQCALDTAWPSNVRVFAKRSLANAPWRFETQPERPDIAEYWRRLRAMELPPDLDFEDVAMRFAAFAPGVDTALVGTTNRVHLRQLVDSVAAGPLPAELVTLLRSRFVRSWPGVI